jgi:hypothetical protein
MDSRIELLGEGRRAFVSESGHCGLVMGHAERGDCICVLFGCDVPVLFRRNVDHYNLIGECHVRGIINREAMKKLEAGAVMAEMFEIQWEPIFYIFLETAPILCKWSNPGS